MISEETVHALLAFRQERKWEQFHTAKNLAIAISVEAGELLEQFQWTNEDGAPPADQAGTAIRHELADVAILMSYLAHDLNVDLDEAIREKLEVNARKYPLELSRGSAKKYRA